MRKTMMIAAAVLSLSSLAAWAAGPAVKFVDAPGGKKIMADAKGMTLYTYDRDEKDVSKCSGGCLNAWPIFAASATDKSEGDWKVIDSTDGKKMWSYKGAPLYYFAKDTKPGDATGESVAAWHFVTQ